MIQHTGGTPAGLSSSNARETLRLRAKLLANVRQYFSDQGVLEVETPLLGSYGVTDPQLENIRAEKPFCKGEWLYLQTSPEYSLKHLLTLGSGSIYQLGKAFRKDSIGRLHLQEFTLLEWYRIDFSLDDLINDVVNLVNELGLERSVRSVTYRQAFLEYANIDPFEASDKDIEQHARKIVEIQAHNETREFWLDLLLSHCVEPELGRDELTFLRDYPAAQAALAKLTKGSDDHEVALRFELYIDGIEIANGYEELTEAEEYRGRFEQDNITREKLGLPLVAIDQAFLSAISPGLPECSGVALGVDRLMLLQQQQQQQR